jgi:lipopolysaccharide export system permease protein
LQEGHWRFASPLLAVAAPLIGFAALMLGGFSRFGLWRQMGAAVLLLIAMQMVNTWASGVAMKDVAAWPLTYLAPVAGAVVAVGLLAYAQRPRHRREAAT